VRVLDQNHMAIYMTMDDKSMNFDLNLERFAI